MRQTIILAFLLIAVVACAPVEPADTQEEMPVPSDSSDESMQESDIETEPEPVQETTQEDTTQEPDHVFTLTGENFAFFMDGEENPDLVVQQGDVVRVEFTSTQGMHDWVVDAFGQTEVVQDTQGMTYVEFVADQAGTFEYYCSVGAHRQQGMRGNLIVE